MKISQELYYSTLSKWRQQQAEGKLDGRRAKIKAVQSEQAQELKRLQQENARLQTRLEMAEAIIEVQKKTCQAVGFGELKQTQSQVAPQGTTEGSLYVPDDYLRLPVL